jgi:hypothetical protein
LAPAGGRNTGADDPAASADPRARRAERLLRLIADSVDPESWRRNGGSPGEAWFVGDRLLILQNASAQVEIGEFLRELRAGLPKVDWPGGTPDERPTFEELLSRRAPGEFRVDDERFDLVLDRIRETFRVNLPKPLSNPYSDAPQKMTLRLQRPTLREALAAWAAQSPDVGPDPAFETYGDAGVAFRREPGPDGEDFVDMKVYDLRGLLPADNGDDGPFERLVDQLQREVMPGTWRDAGESHGGAVRQPYRGRALIVQTRGTHRKIRQWLDAAAAASRGPAPTAP